MTLEDVLLLPSLLNARLVTSNSDLLREVRWAHVVELPKPQPWAQRDQLILTTGFAFRDSSQERRAFIRELSEAGVSAVGLAVPQRFESFPVDMVEEAEKLRLPLLEIPWEVPFASITHDIHRALIAEQDSVIRRSERIHRALTSAALTQRSLGDLVKVLGQLLGRSVVIEAADGRLLAVHTVEGMEDTARRETLSTGRASRIYAQYLEELGIAEAITKDMSARRVDASPDGTIAARVVCSIRLLNEHVGFIWIIEGPSLTDLDVRAAEHGALLAALYISHQREMQATELRAGIGFLDSILQGHFQLTPRSQELAHLAGYAPTGTYSLAMAVIDRALPMSEQDLVVRDKIASDIRIRLQELGGSTLITYHLNRIFFLLPADGRVSHLSDIIAYHQVALTVSSAATGFESLRKAFQDLQKVASYSKPGQIQQFRDLLIPRILGGDSSVRQDLRTIVLEPLAREGGSASLLVTLKCLVGCNYILSHAAHELKIHPSTLRYRYERIEQILGLSLIDPQARFLVQTTLLMSEEDED